MAKTVFEVLVADADGLWGRRFRFQYDAVAFASLQIGYGRSATVLAIDDALAIDSPLPPVLDPSLATSKV